MGGSVGQSQGGLARKGNEEAHREGDPLQGLTRKSLVEVVCRAKKKGKRRIARHTDQSEVEKFEGGQ